MMPVSPLRRPVVTPPSATGCFPPINGLNHFAFRCRNAEETRHFYEDILGLPLAATIYHDRVPSTGEFQPYFHIFFELGDGSYLAFFDLLDDQGHTPDPKTPAWVNHLALDVPTREALLAAKDALEAAGIEVLGIVDHKWFDSIYFFDPNGIRLELVLRTASLDQMRDKAAKAHGLLASRNERFRQFQAGELTPAG
jgi:glyoxylase I family protein